MELIVSLIMVPCVAALLMLVVRADKARDVLCVAFAAVIALLSIAFAVQNLGAGSLYFDLPIKYSHFLAVVNIVIDITVGLYIVCYSVKYRRVLPLVLAIGQILTTLWFEYNIQREVQFESQMHVDSLGIIMVLILGIVGTGICVYALGYMKDFQAHHPEQKDRRPWFFALMFAFLPPCTTLCFPTTCVGFTQPGKSPRCARSCSSASRRPKKPSTMHSARSS